MPQGFFMGPVLANRGGKLLAEESPGGGVPRTAVRSVVPLPVRVKPYQTFFPLHLPLLRYHHVRQMRTRA